MLILLVGHQSTYLCTKKLSLKHELDLLGIGFKLTLIWVDFLEGSFCGWAGGVGFGGKIPPCLNFVRIMLET